MMQPKLIITKCCNNETQIPNINTIKVPKISTQIYMQFFILFLLLQSLNVRV